MEHGEDWPRGPSAFVGRKGEQSVRLTWLPGMGNKVWLFGVGFICAPF